MMRTSSSAHRPGEAVVPIESCDAIVCDLDGVVYRGDGEVPGAPNALQDIAAHGVHVLYATNNASRVPSEVAEHLRRLGAPARDDDVVTSAEAGATIVAEHVPAGSAVLALGGEGLSWALTSAGFQAIPASQIEGQPVAAVLQGLGRQLTVADFEVAARLIAEGAVWVVTNGDTTLPLQWGTAPGNGAYVDLLRTATRREPIAVAGKPEPPLYELAVDRLATDSGRTLAIGDRLDTDIAGARAAGLPSAWVLTGVDRPSALLATDLDPTFVVASLAELLRPYAVPVRHADTWRCAGATARFEDGTLHVELGDAAPIEAVRAGLAALLERRDAQAGSATTPHPPEQSRPASPTAALSDAASVLDDLVAAAGGR
jgi:HAD superfamily hydrolase (TIGR01450 family)